MGAILLTTGSFGIAGTLDLAIRNSLGRELAAALGSGTPQRVRCTLVSALAFTSLTSLLVVLMFAVFAVLALLGVFTMHSDEPGLAGALAALIGASGIISTMYLLLGPYSVALVADQRVGLDNLLLIVRRLVPVVAAVIAFEFIRPDGTLAERLYGYAMIRAVLGILEAVTKPLIARLVVRHLRFDRRAFDRGVCGEIASTVWQTAQFQVGASMTHHVLDLLINLLFGLSANGLWGVVVRVAGLVKMVSDAILHGIFAIAAHLHEQGRRDAIVNLMTRSLRYQLAVAMPTVAFCIVFLTPILDLWVGKQLASDTGLEDMGWTAAEAMGLTAQMAVFALIAELFRASTRGIERILFGMGHVRSYVWFAKWSLLLIAGIGGGLMWLFDSPVPGVIVVAAVAFLYSDVIIPMAAHDRAAVPVGAVLRQAVPPPLLMCGLFIAPLLLVRLAMPELTVFSLIALVLGCGAVLVPLLFFVGFDASERHRLREMLLGGFRRIRTRTR